MWLSDIFNTWKPSDLDSTQIRCGDVADSPLDPCCHAFLVSLGRVTSYNGILVILEGTVLMAGELSTLLHHLRG